MKKAILLLYICFSISLPAFPQGSAKGRRIDLTTKLQLNNGTTGQFAQLFVPDYYEVPSDGKFSLVFHMHSASWAAEDELYKANANSLLFNIHLGGFSSSYQKYFAQSANFRKILDTVLSVIKSYGIIKSPSVKSLFLTSFSAGYAGVREVLKTPEYYALIKALTLADGLHCSSESSAREVQMKDFLRFAKDARAGSKIFILTHSSIKTSGYDNTTQTSDYLIKGLGARRVTSSAVDEIGIRYSICDTGNFHLKGYLGETASDHLKHLYAMNRMLEKVMEITQSTTSINESENLPAASDIELRQNYPNPFNSSTIIRYSLSSSISQAVHVELKVFNSLGEEVALLADKYQMPGTYEVHYDGRGRGGELPSGIYFCRLIAGNFVKLKKMMLIK